MRGLGNATGIAPILEILPSQQALILGESHCTPIQPMCLTFVQGMAFDQLRVDATRGVSEGHPESHFPSYHDRLWCVAMREERIDKKYARCYAH